MKSIFVFPFQGQRTCPCWRVVKIDIEHKLSAPLKDLEAPVYRWSLCFCTFSLLYKENPLSLVLGYKMVHVILVVFCVVCWL